MNVATVLEHAAEAERAGFTKCAEQLKAKAELARKLALAYEFYRYVPQEKIILFNDRLKATTNRQPSATEESLAVKRLYGDHAMVYRIKVKEICDQLVFDSLEKYDGCPPLAVIQATRIAQEKGIFDGFEVAHVQPYATQVIHPDPIVFGRINGCTDCFFIGEWGSDVRISDLLGAHEG